MLFIILDDQFKKQYADTYTVSDTVRAMPILKPPAIGCRVEPATLFSLQLAIYFWEQHLGHILRVVFNGSCWAFEYFPVFFRFYVCGCKCVWAWVRVHLLFISFKLPCGWPPCHNMAVHHIETFCIPHSWLHNRIRIEGPFWMVDNTQLTNWSADDWVGL